MRDTHRGARWRAQGAALSRSVGDATTCCQALSDEQLEALLRGRAAARGADLAVARLPSGGWEAKFVRADPKYYGTCGEAADRRMALAALLAADDLNRAASR